jgi:hypothetical protein
MIHGKMQRRGRAAEAAEEDKAARRGRAGETKEYATVEVHGSDLLQR